MAEYYHILDYKGLLVDNVSLLATLVFGLRPESRVMLAVCGNKVGTDTLLLASAVDRLSLLLWSNTEDAQKGRNKPESMVELIQGRTKDKECRGFNTIEEFEAERLRILNGD